MRACDNPEQLTSHTCAERRPRFSVVVADEGGLRTIRVIGDIDVATRSKVYEACVAGNSRDVVIDLRATTFIDCGGYSALVAARRELEDRGGRLSWVGSTGQPQRFLKLLGVLEQAA